MSNDIKDIRLGTTSMQVEEQRLASHQSVLAASRADIDAQHSTAAAAPDQRALAELIAKHGPDKVLDWWWMLTGVRLVAHYTREDR